MYNYFPGLLICVSREFIDVCNISRIGAILFKSRDYVCHWKSRNHLSIPAIRLMLLVHYSVHYMIEKNPLHIVIAIIFLYYIIHTLCDVY